MVRHATNRNGDEIDVLTYACDVLPETRLKIFWNQLLPMLGAEYRM